MNRGMERTPFDEDQGITFGWDCCTSRSVVAGAGGDGERELGERGAPIENVVSDAVTDVAGSRGGGDNDGSDKGGCTVWCRRQEGEEDDDQEQQQQQTHFSWSPPRRPQCC